MHKARIETAEEVDDSRAEYFMSRAARMIEDVENVNRRFHLRRNPVAMTLFREMHKPRYQLTDYLEAETVVLELLGLIRLAQTLDSD